MLIVGLTGGIATGKSTVSALLAEQGLPIVDADKIAKDVVRKVSPVPQVGVQLQEETYSNLTSAVINLDALAVGGNLHSA